jgi:DNA-binding transcriptional regulator YiaG
MPNLGTILNEEIRRLSRRSCRPLYAQVKKDVAMLKHMVAALKRDNQKLLKDNARLMADLHSRMTALPAVSESEARQIRIGPKLILAQRKRLELSRQDFAKLLSVSAGAVLTWETGRSRPKPKVKAAFAALRKLGKRAAQERLEILASVNSRKKSVTENKPAARQQQSTSKS